MTDPHQVAWEWVEKYRNLLKSMARKQARAAGPAWRQLADELYSEAIDRAPRVAALHQPELGSLYTYMRRSLGWYMHKLVRKRRLEADALETAVLDERSCSHAIGSELEDSEEVCYLLQDLSDMERTVLLAKAVSGMTLEEIADDLGVAKGTVHDRYHKAIAKARAARDRIS